MTSTAPAPTDALDTLELFGAAYIRTREALGNAQVAQWEKGATPRPVEDTPQRSTGQVNDPTWQTFIDSRRLALREAVKRAEKAIQEADEAMAEALAILEAAHTEPSGASES